MCANVFRSEGAALLWDENYQKKPAYQATLDAITSYEPPAEAPVEDPVEDPVKCKRSRKN